MEAVKKVVEIIIEKTLNNKCFWKTELGENFWNKEMKSPHAKKGFTQECKTDLSQAVWMMDFVYGYK